MTVIDTASHGEALDPIEIDVDRPDYRSGSHLKGIFAPGVIAKLAKYLVLAIREAFPDVEAIACCGLGGTLVAPMVADLLQLPLIVVRKACDVPGETTHSDCVVEGYDRGCDYVFVDDLIEDGTTARYTFEQIAKRNPAQHPIGIALWRDGDYFGLGDVDSLTWNRQRIATVTAIQIEEIDLKAE